MAKIDPRSRTWIASMRTHAYGLQAVAQDLEAAGISAIATRAQAAILLSSVAAFEERERSISASASSGVSDGHD